MKEQEHFHRFGQELISFAESMERIGKTFSTKVLENKRLESIGNFEKLYLPFKDKHKSNLMLLQRVRYIDSEPVILIENLINKSICPGIENVDFEKETLFQVIERLSNESIKFGVRDFNAVSIDNKMSEILDISYGKPILHLHQTTYLSHRVPVESSNIWIKSNKYPVTSYLHRN